MKSALLGAEGISMKNLSTVGIQYQLATELIWALGIRLVSFV